MNSFLLCEKKEVKVKLKKNGGCATFTTLEVSSYDASYPLLSFKCPNSSIWERPKESVGILSAAFNRRKGRRALEKRDTFE